MLSKRLAEDGAIMHVQQKSQGLLSLGAQKQWHVASFQLSRHDHALSFSAILQAEGHGNPPHANRFDLAANSIELAQTGFQWHLKSSRLQVGFHPD